MRFDWDYLLHFAGGLGIATAALALGAFAFGVERATGVQILVGAETFLLVGGVVREWYQSEWRWLRTAHKWIEGLAWSAGGLFSLPLLWVFF